MITAKIPHNALALGFIQDMASDLMIVITNEDGFRGRSFRKIVWLKTPTIACMQTARAGLPANGRFGWLCEQPDMFLAK